MQTVTPLFESICATPGWRTLVRVTIDGTTYTMADLISLSKETQTMENVAQLIGNVMSSTATVNFIPSDPVPTAAEVNIEICVTDGTDTSEWIPHGTFYVSQRKKSAFGSGDAIELTCFDAMCKTDALYATSTLFDTWPQTDTDVVDEIASIIGVTVDSRTRLNGYAVPYPGEYTMREILQYIAVTNCGNWIITPDDKLRFVPVVTGVSPDTFTIGLSVGMYEDLGLTDAYTGVNLYYNDETAFVSGTDTVVLEADCPWATQAIADAMLTELTGYQHQGFNASGATIPPHAELGDVAVVNSTPFAIDSIVVDYGSLYRPSLESPGPDDVEQEYPYLSPAERELKRTVKVAQEYYGTSVTHGSGITVTRTDGGNTYNSINLNSDQFVATDANGNMIMVMDFVNQIFKWLGDIVIEDGSIVLDNLDPEVTNYITSTANGILAQVQQMNYVQLDDGDTHIDPADPDKQYTLAEVYQMLYSQINQTAEQISFDFGSRIEGITGTDDPEASFDNLTDVTSNLAELNAHFIFESNGTMRIVVSNSVYQLKLANDGMEILGENGNPVCKFTANQTVLPQETVIPEGGTLTMGKFRWIPRDNGNLSLIYVG